MLRRCLLGTAAAVGVWSVGVAGAAPAAVAADVQSKQWYLDAMDAEKIWKSATGEGIKVAVIDTGVNASTPSLQGKVLDGFDATKSAGEATDDYDGHGTTMAELIAGSGDGGGLQGLAPEAEIIPFRVVTDTFKGKGNSWSVEDAIKAAADSDAHIINMSIGGEFKTDQEQKLITYARNKGKLLFASTGNNAREGNKAEFPAAYPEVVGVAASDPEGKVADYSQHGGIVDIAAPGSDIPKWCDATFTRYCDGDGGTSAATAIASASAALIWSAHPEWTANQVLRVMFESAGRGEDWKEGTLSNYLGHGIVRPGAHINRGIGKPGDANVDPLTNQPTTGGASGSPTTPKPSAPASSQAPEGKPGSDATVAGSSEEAGAESQLGVIIGVAAAVVVIAGGAFAVVRRRRDAH